MRAPIYEASSEYCPHIREEAAIEVKFVCSKRLRMPSLVKPQGKIC